MQSAWVLQPTQPSLRKPILAVVQVMKSYSTELIAVLGKFGNTVHKDPGPSSAIVCGHPPVTRLAPKQFDVTILGSVESVSKFCDGSDAMIVLGNSGTLFCMGKQIETEASDPEMGI